jgi:phosphoribosylformylglycinamidine synthase II
MTVKSSQPQEDPLTVTQQALDEIALSRDEYDLIVQKLEREPTPVELGMFGALWSEHCGYKHSKPLLSMFPTTGDAVQVQAGEENAGVVDIGGGLSVVFKVESHNHPSAVEPFQGAATGVGGIIRDILAMGARPMALLNSLRFGPLSDPRNRFLFRGVVAGISSYGNCIGVPDVGGEIAFAPGYGGNPLINAMCVGLLPQGALVRSAAVTPGNSLMLVGAATGRDGIHGASGLASRTFEDEREMRPTVQVGDPFLEKVLVEACLEAARSGHLEGMQDLGAAGLTSSAVESASKGGTGLELDISLVPRREVGMTPYEVMLSESQERMLLIVEKGHEADVQRLFKKWDLLVVAIGTVTGDRIARVYDGSEVVAEVPVEMLVEAPKYRPGGSRPRYLDGLHATPMPVAPVPREAGNVLKSLLASPNITSKRSVYRQYDHEVQTNTVVRPGEADAAVLRLRESGTAIALSIDGNGRFAYLEPYVGGAMAVAEACRNVACTGAKPLAVTNCLNFGDPRNSEVYYQLEECIRGMADACEALGVPVVSGNVSLYNETQGESIYPTPVVGAVGLLPNAHGHVTAGFRSAGDVVLLLGAGAAEAGEQALAGSEYLAHVHGLVAGQPSIDLKAEARLQGALVALVGQGLLRSAHDCSDGGLAVALAESCLLGGLGFRGDFAVESRWDSALFGEQPSRVVVSLAPECTEAVARRVREFRVPWVRLGVVAGDCLMLPGLLDESLAELADAFEGGLERAMLG